MANLGRDGDRAFRPDGGGSRRPRRGLSVAVLVVVVASLVVVAVLVGIEVLRSGGPFQAAASPTAPASGNVPTDTATSSPTSAPATLGAAATATSRPSSAAPAPLTGALIAIVDDGGALVTVDERGGSRVTYPTNGVAQGFPAWSPDGSHIAVVAMGANDTTIEVFAVDRTTGVAREPTIAYRSADQLPFYLYWLPDGRHISFLTGETAGGLALRIAPLDGTPVDAKDATAILRRGAPLYFDWVRTDRALLHVGGGADAFTGQVGLDGTGIGSPIAATWSFRTATLSGDGRYVAYARSATGGAGEIVVEATDTATSHTIPVFGPAAMLFDPTGDTLATIAAGKPVSDTLALPVGPLRLIDPASGAMRTLLDGSVVAFFWAPDGRTIAALHLVSPSTAPTGIVGRLTLAGNGARVPPAAATAAGTSLGLAFIDVATGAVRSQRVVPLADPFVVQLLPYFDQYALSHRLWSPDSALILLPLAAASGQDQLVAIPADGAEPRPIADGSKASWSP